MLRELRRVHSVLAEAEKQDTNPSERLDPLTLNMAMVGPERLAPRRRGAEAQRCRDAIVGSDGRVG